jgi:hypothetical protein
LAIVVLLTTNARADSVTLNIANANLATQGAGPYATFSFTYTPIAGGGTTVGVTATGLHNFVFGDHLIIDLNLSSTAGTVSNFQNAAGILTVACVPGSASPCPAQVNGFGNFNFVLDDGPGFSSGGYSTLTFTFNVSGTVSSIANLLASNGTASAAAHMALATNTACTGYAANGGTQGEGSVDNSSCVAPTPDGGMTVMLLGGALVGLATLRRMLPV